MEITQKSAKELVRTIYKFENELKSTYKGDINSTNYLITLRKLLLTMTLEKLDDKNVKLVLLKNSKKPLINVNTEEETRLLLFYLLEISNSIDINGLVQTDRISYDLFNELFKNI